MACKCAYPTDEYHGWGCTVTGGACEFIIPNSKACAEMYGEGPDAEDYNDEIFAKVAKRFIKEYL